MNTAPYVPLPYRIVALMQERNRLFAYPVERLGIEIRATRFRCDCCGACCNRMINSHIFLLDHDVKEVQSIDPSALEPAPDPEFCDQYGTLYVSGYALRMKDDDRGSCWFLEDNRCRIYERRFSGCRIYPYMLRRSAGAKGDVAWRKFSREYQHGIYDKTLSQEECLTIAREVKEYENAVLTQQISFLEILNDYFRANNLWHDPEAHKDRIQRFRQGRPVDIKVFCAGELLKHE